MLKQQNKIIIVDDNETQLMDLAKVFLDSGVACKTIEYNQFYNNPLNNIRIAFFDINLTSTSIDLTQTNFDYVTDSTLRDVFNKLVIALQSCIDINNGPFALIFWSSNTKVIENFISYINDPARKISLAKPFIIKGINKESFIGVENIKQEIVRIFESEPTIKLLLEFESNVQDTTSQTLNEIYNLIPNNSNWGDNQDFMDNFDKIFSKIAIASLGYDHAKENPDKAIYEALMPLVSNNVINSIDSDLWKNILVTLSKSRKNAQPEYPKDFKSSTLNSIFHIYLNRNKDLKSRGIIIEINIDQKFTNLFSIPFNDWYSRLLPGLNKDKRKDSILIAIEISSSCDYSQLKPRTHKYLLGVMVKSIHKEFLNNEKIPQSLFILDGNYNILEDEYFICFNLNYAFSVVDNHEIFVKGLFSFKKEITDMIGNRYANHVSRIGITSF